MEESVSKMLNELSCCFVETNQNVNCQHSISLFPFSNLFPCSLCFFCLPFPFFPFLFALFSFFLPFPF